MIRNAVIHIANEQPLLADLFDLPTAADVSLVCTNVRMLDGKKPIFVDHSASLFVFPYGTIRFIEMPGAAAPADPQTAGDAVIEASPQPETTPEAEPDDGELELDEDFLRRIREV
ncbi:MAG TPA: hypothetical protein VFP22_04920 [Candidatus Limnocylindrales bacterium]|nr:hypothetical protein [Candidatus Limnocylindrales bacterium]